MLSEISNVNFKNSSYSDCINTSSFCFNSPPSLPPLFIPLLSRAQIPMPPPLPSPPLPSILPFLSSSIPSNFVISPKRSINKSLIKRTELQRSPVKGVLFFFFFAPWLRLVSPSSRRTRTHTKRSLDKLTHVFLPIRYVVVHRYITCATHFQSRLRQNIFHTC